MAFGQKYQVETYTNNGGHYYVKIYQDAWSGATTELNCAANGIVLDYPAASDIFDPIRGSSLTLNLISETDFQFEEFFDTTFGEYKVELYNVTTASIEWEGFNSADIYTENFEVAPYGITLRFVCGLAELKNIPFSGVGGAFPLKNIIWVFRLCLNEINDLNINDCFDYFENSHSNGVNDSALMQTYVDTNTYVYIEEGIEKNISCYDVLSNILRSLACYIVQSEGAWWVIRVKNSYNYSQTYISHPAAVGDEDRGIVFSDAAATKIISRSVVDSSSYAYATNLRHVESTGTISFTEKIKRLRYIYLPYKNGFGLIKNGDFIRDYGLNDSLVPAFWSVNVMDSTDFTSYVNEQQSIVFFKDLDQDNPLTNNKNIYQTINGIHIATTDRIGFDIRAYYQNYVEEDSVLLGYSVKIERVSDGATRYLKVNAGKIVWITSTTEYRNYISLVKNTETNRSYTYDAEGNFPFDAKCNITVKIYKPYAGVANTGGWVQLKRANFYYLASGSNTQEFIYTSEIADSKEVYELKAYHGDGVNYGSNGAFRLSNGTLTNAWGGSNLPIHEVVSDDVLTILSGNNKLLDLTIEGKIIPIQRVNFSFDFPSGTTNSYFALLGFSRDIMTDFYTCNLQEVRSWVFTANTFSGIDDLPPSLEPILDPEPIKTKTVLTNGTTTNSDGDTINYFA